MNKMEKKSFKQRKKEFSNKVFQVISSENVMTKQELQILTGLGEREVRRQLHDIAIYYALISVSNKRGYRLANTKVDTQESINAEIEELDHSINEDKKRANEIKARMSRKIAVKSILEKKLGELNATKEH